MQLSTFRVLTLLLATTTLLLSCGRGDDVVDTWDAQKRMATAIEARRVKCSASSTPFVPPVPHPVRRADLRQCENELLAGGCPFTQPPLGCLLLVLRRAPEDRDGPN